MLMLRTCAGVAFAGAPATLPPEAQTMASMRSAVSPPHLPSTRTGWMRTDRATPAPKSPFHRAPTVPATCVPCQLEGAAGSPGQSLEVCQSPSSVASLSRPLPSRARAASLMKS